MRKAVGIGLIVAIVGALAIVQYLNFSGFCYSQKRYLSDDELIDKAIEQILERPPPMQQKGQYGSIAEFRQFNSQCCKLYRDGHERLSDGIYVRFFGWYVVMAEIWYKVKDENPNKYYEAFITLNACGEVKKRGGWPQSRAPRQQRS